MKQLELQVRMTLFLTVKTFQILWTLQYRDQRYYLKFVINEVTKFAQPPYIVAYN